MNQSMPILETRGLCRRFGGVVAVDNVDFQLQQNELRCIIGPNGAGKSTFFKCLTGQMQVSAGSVYLGGTDVTKCEPFDIARLKVATKTQVPNLFDGLSARENIWISARRAAKDNREADQIADASLEQAALKSVANTRVGQLAHGVRQWVELAMIMASRPKLVLLDEPIAGMTKTEVSRMVDVLAEIRKSASVIVVEHDMKFVRRIANKVTVFHNGRVFLEDECDRVFQDQRVRDIYLGREFVA